MAIATTTPQAKVGFIVNATSADASGCEELVAAVAGKKIKIRHLMVNSTDAIAITIEIIANMHRLIQKTIQ